MGTELQIDTDLKEHLPIIDQVLTTIATNKKKKVIVLIHLHFSLHNTVKNHFLQG